MPVSAVVPAYNEAERIGPVLAAICASPLISEVVVVDDGSEDDLAAAVARFPGVRYLRQPVNAGKGRAMERGVRETSGDIVLFCDADVVGITPEMIGDVIAPVQEGQCDMFVGIFETPKRELYDRILSFTAFPSGINSGLRAMRREAWDALPDFYKRSYHVESGLNYLVRWKFRGPGYVRMSYTQVVKEKKYGLLKGSYFRWKMHFEIVSTFARIHCYERFFGFGKGRA